MAQTQEVAPVACVQCQARYNAPVTTIINVNQNPSLKNALLQGQLNLSRCPQCNFANPVNIPILYFDGQKELALAFVPSNLQLSHADEQKLIGRLTNRLIESLPPEQRKGYLLNPQTFLTGDSLIKAVLAADGITEEVLQAQQNRLQLLNTLLQTESETRFKALVAENSAHLDNQFFELLTSLALQALQTGERARGEQLLNFRQMVAGAVEGGQELLTQIDRQMGLQTLSPEKLLQDLKETTGDDEFMALVAAGRPLLDYTFFQDLTGQIEAAAGGGNTAEAEQLKALRARILDASAKIDDQTRQAALQAGQLLQELLAADNPQELVLQKINQIDELVLDMLVANIQEADKQGQAENAKKLAQLYELILAALETQMPPEMQLLNRLMRAPGPEAIKPILEQHTEQITPQFIGLLDRLQADMQARGQPSVLAFVGEVKRQIATIKPEL